MSSAVPNQSMPAGQAGSSTSRPVTVRTPPGSDSAMASRSAAVSASADGRDRGPDVEQVHRRGHDAD